MVTNASPTNRVAASQPPRRDRTTDSRDLTQQDFLQLILAQMKNQNPLEPQKNSEFIAQIAQFSMLEQLRSLNESITSLQTAATFSQASSMLGKTVLTKSDGSDNALMARLEPADKGGIENIAGLPPADAQPGTWELRTEADGSVQATFKPKSGAPPTASSGKFDAAGKLEGLIPGVTLFSKTPQTGGTDRIVFEPVYAGKVERIVMQKQVPKLLVGGRLVPIADVYEITDGASG